MSTVAPAATLRGFYREIVRPQLKERQLSKSQLETYESAVARFEQFSGADVPLAALKADLVHRFEAYLFEVCPSEGRYRHLREAFQRILACRANQPPRQSKRLRPCLPTPPPDSLRHFFESVYLPHKLPGCNRGTVDSYRAMLYGLYKHYERDIALHELTDHLAADHTQWLLASGRRPATINAIRRYWFACWRYAHELGHCETSPRLKKLPEAEPAPDAWSLTEVRRLVAATETLKTDRISGIHGNLYWRALLLVGYYTALRRRALFALTWHDVDLSTATINAPPSAMKTRRGQKFLIGADAVEALRAILCPCRTTLFPTTACNKQISAQFNRIIRNAGLPTSKSRTPHFHRLRRSVATAIADARGIHAAAELLGHSATFVTRRYVDRTHLKGHDFRDVLQPLVE